MLASRDPVKPGPCHRARRPDRHPNSPRTSRADAATTMARLNRNGTGQRLPCPLGGRAAQPGHRRPGSPPGRAAVIPEPAAEPTAQWQPRLVVALTTFWRFPDARPKGRYGASRPFQPHDGSPARIRQSARNHRPPVTLCSSSLASFDKRDPPFCRRLCFPGLVVRSAQIRMFCAPARLPRDRGSVPTRPACPSALRAMCPPYEGKPSRITWFALRARWDHLRLDRCRSEFS
jgi:hypothetical protein